MDHQTIQPVESQPLTPASQPQSQITESSRKRSPNKLLYILLAILLIAGASFGTYFWQHKQIANLKSQISSFQSRNSKLSKELQSNSSSTSAKPTRPSAQQSSAPQARYLDIVQLGVKFQLPSSVQDAVYVMSGDGTIAYLSSTSLMKLQRTDEPSHLNACDPGIAGVPDPLGSIHEGSQARGGEVTFSGPQATCSNTNAVNQLETTQENALAQAFNSTKASD